MTEEQKRAAFKQFVEDTVAILPEEERECAREFMEWFDATIASREMMALDPRGWQLVEEKMWVGWRAAWVRVHELCAKNAGGE
jgi:hypothetical protein